MTFVSPFPNAHRCCGDSPSTSDSSSSRHHYLTPRSERYVMHHHGMLPSSIAHVAAQHVMSPLPTIHMLSIAPPATVAFAHVGLAHTFHILVSFILGGLFFSTALSVITAFAAFGKENIDRALALTRIVIERVWNIFTFGVKTAWETFVEGKRWRWREAWAILKEQLTLTRQAAAEGVEAIKLEASLYSAAVGQPGLIALQYFIDNLTPRLLASMAKENFVKAIAEVKNPNVRRIRVEEFDFGNKGPTLVAARAYDLKNDNAIAMDVDVDFQSEMKAKVKVTTTRLGVSVPVSIKNFYFDGVVRLILTPLIDEPPGFAAALISFPTSPKIGLDVSLSAVEITKNPWLRTELLKEIQKNIKNEFLWPRRIIVPSMVAPSSPRTILSKVELDKLSQSDPLLQAERRIDENELIRKTKLKRELPDEGLIMDVFVGEGERVTANATDAAGDDGSDGDSKNMKEKKDGKKRGGWSPPWAKKEKTGKESIAKA